MTELQHFLGYTRTVRTLCQLTHPGHFLSQTAPGLFSNRAEVQKGQNPQPVLYF